VVTVSWDATAHRYRLENCSDRWVSITLVTWPSAIQVRLAPRQTYLAAISEFDLPYRADFIDCTPQ
jgi:hypothetical protein